MKVIGIDPGVSGAFAVWEDGNIIHLEDFVKVEKDLDVDTLALQLRSWDADKVFIEKVASRPGQGVVSVFRFGRTVGALEGVCHGIPVGFITPTKWKEYYGIVKDQNLKTTENKRLQKILARDIVRERWPHLEPQLRLVRNADRAEAALMAHYGAMELM